MLSPREHRRLQQHIHGVDVDRIAMTFDALSEPNRCLIFRALLKGTAISVGELASIVGISDPLASQHLKVLSQAELIERHKDGKKVYYHINHRNNLVTALQKAVET